MTVKSLPEIKIHGIWIEYKSSVLLAIDSCAKGVIYGNTFRWCINQSNYGAGGYGVAVKGTYSGGSYNWPASYPDFGTENTIFIEDNIFYGCKQSVELQDTGNAVARYNTISGTWGPHGQIFTHGPSSTSPDSNAGLQLEVYNNDISLDVVSLSTFAGHHGVGPTIRSGHALIYDNAIHQAGSDSTSSDAIILSDIDISGHTSPAYTYPDDYPVIWQPRDVYAWNNTYEGGAVNITESSSWFVADRESTNSMGTYYDYRNLQKPGYVAYAYPHPLRGETPPSFPTDWLYRQLITVSHANIDENLQNFPLIVKFSHNADIGTNAQADGDDIRFSFDGINLLPYHRVYFTIEGDTTASGMFVVKADLSHVTDTSFYIYYGNGGAADDSDSGEVYALDDIGYGCKIVQMGNDLTTSTTEDMTSYSNDGTKKAANEPVEISGLLYNAQHFDGTDDYINYGSAASVDNVDPYTIEYLVYLDGWGSVDYNRLSCKEGTTSNQQSVVVRNALHSVNASHNAATGGTAANSRTSNDTLSLGAWTLIGVTYDNTGDRTLHVFINGVESSYAVTPTAMVGTIRNDSSNSLVVGNRLGGTERLMGR